MVLIIDNYDSFTYNLVDLVKRFTEAEVFRHDAITIEEIEKKNPDGILISPGPGRPENSGISSRIIPHFLKKSPILGVCLGHQVIGEAFGAKTIHAEIPMHGKTSRIVHDEEQLFHKLPNPLVIMRYHSLVLDKKSLPEELKITAETENGTIMGIRHRDFPVEGVQFHPESILSQLGEAMIRNWLKQICS